MRLWDPASGQPGRRTPHRAHLLVPAPAVAPFADGRVVLAAAGDDRAIVGVAAR
ncbi:hypothetical protein [Frankia sp. Cas3]|uniref:hypothetical protein n=1 Tax=Frankia sp. Cas3 TaxID=3073926 RepID=UPI002AD51548|nr:hypothetical protein [Frankia sp. Cas3]